MQSDKTLHLQGLAITVETKFICAVFFLCDRSYKREDGPDMLRSGCAGQTLYNRPGAGGTGLYCEAQ